MSLHDIEILPPLRPVPSEALDAFCRVRLQRAIIGDKRRCTASLVIYVNDAPGAPRPIEWDVIADGQVVESSQPHLVGRRRSA